MSYCVYVLLGPGKETATRTQDMLSSLWAYAPGRANADCFLVLDRFENLDLLKPWLDRFQNTVTLVNPLSNTAASVNDRVTAGTLAAVKAIVASGNDYDFALKLDDDALIINEFHDSLRDFFNEDPSIGIAGSFECFPDGVERPGHKTWAPIVRAATSLKNAHRELRRSLRGHRPFTAHLHSYRRVRLGLSAKRLGYRLGMHVQGGSYAVSPKAIESIADRIKDPYLFNYTGLGEDTAISLLCASSGYRLVSFNGRNEVFGVWWRNPTLPPSELVERGYSIIHSLKYDDTDLEQEVRNYFQKRRNVLQRPDSVA